MTDPDIADIERRMNGAVEALKREFAGLRTGRASAALLEPISVDAYASKMPLNQVGTVGVPDPRMLTVQVWDNSLVSAVEKSIRDSGLGLNPQTEGNLVRVPIPELTEERRVELTRSPTNMPNRPVSPHGTCVATAWTISSGWRRMGRSRRTISASGRKTYKN